MNPNYSPLLSTACFVCGAPPHSPTPLHEYVSNVQVDAELAQEQCRSVSVHYPDGTTDPAAHYVNTYRPY